MAKLVRSALGVVAVVFLTFGLERLVLESWPWWGHFFVAGGAAYVLWRRPNRWPFPSKDLQAEFSKLAAHFNRVRHRIEAGSPSAVGDVVAVRRALTKRFGIPCPAKPRNVNDDEMRRWACFLVDVEGWAKAGDLEAARHSLDEQTDPTHRLTKEQALALVLRAAAFKPHYRRFFGIRMGLDKEATQEEAERWLAEFEHDLLDEVHDNGYGQLAFRIWLDATERFGGFP